LIKKNPAGETFTPCYLLILKTQKERERRKEKRRMDRVGVPATLLSSFGDTCVFVRRH
jgi:hypothetical protein